MKFTRLSLRAWRQFDAIDIQFHPRLTIITGANGAGKSTLLRLLSQHFGWQNTVLATPTYTREGVLRYFSGLFDFFIKPTQLRDLQIGSLGYSDGSFAGISVPTVNGIEYHVNFSSQKSVQGLHIASHRPVPTYQQVSNIPTNPVGADQAYEAYRQELLNKYNNSYTAFSPTYRMKESLISMATFGPGNQYVQRNESVARLFQGFKDVLSKTLPETIGFKDISVRIPDVVIVTSSGDFIIDAASGGLMSLIDLAWQIFLFSHDKQEFVVSIDEPENHLHPSMQRALLGRLLSAFPRAQFVVATHSPFVVSSVKDSSVYALDYVASPTSSVAGIARRIQSHKLELGAKAGTASDILRSVLGVPVTLPEWAEDELRKIAGDYRIEDLNSAGVSELRNRLESAGLGEYYSDALGQIVGTK